MSSSNQNEYFRSWMDKNHQDESGLLTEEFAEGLQQFMSFASNQERTLRTGKMYCPCPTCQNRRFGTVAGVWKHLYSRGFMAGYKVWYSHGETDMMMNFGSTSQHNNLDGVGEQQGGLEEHIGTVQMVQDRYRGEEPNFEAQNFFEMLDAAKSPLYDGCRDGISPLSSATRMMSIKTDYNLSEQCVDAIADFVKDILPEDNLSPATYYEIQKLVSGLGLPYQMIDVCIDNCMLYWRRDADRSSCRFCRKPRYQETSGRNKIPYKRMWYLPITERLKRLYRSERTAEAMRWHGEHVTEGEIAHPSDAKAWKHFQSMYPAFAFERRNVYLGLSTDGFNPFGSHGRQYSLWPVIVTPYNLPPSLCMKREFLFLTILVPGPEHPRRSLDVFLQPLIYELQMLWEHGVEVYDISSKQNFMMHAVLMWTISDFPAYGMLSGWTTHGRLACPYCQDNTDAFQLKNGRKTSWFDCHRRFLPPDHPYRINTTLFTKNKKVFDGPPPEIDGNSCLTQLRDFGAESTVRCGGNGHDQVDGYGEHHNWHKRSIFWELPYWKDHILRHNLDVMHIEKNFFDNIMNTILNVKGKTKDNLKSRLDLPEICARSSLHVDGRGNLPMPIYRLDAASKQEFFQWIVRNVKFPDGYASNLRNCVDIRECKFSGLKSHDCHVMMQRLLPFCFAGLLPENVHQAIAGIRAFFRDLCSHSLTAAGIQNLQDKIPIILCNLEKIFPPSFFDVMEHLPIHLAREAELGGPVQYRWMYVFERYMFHLKKKVKNLSRVEGSIVAQSINEETSHFASYYFDPEVQTKSRRPSRHDDGGQRPIYPVEVPLIFSQIGRLSGRGKSRRLTEQEQLHLHKYILANCEEVMTYERIYMEQIRDVYPDYSEDQLSALKENEFVNWLKFYVKFLLSTQHPIEPWLEELAAGPKFVAVSYPMYCTRGYAFGIFRDTSTQSTFNHGISAKSGDVIYYGVLREILEIHYPGILDLRCVAFCADWYNPTVGYGVRTDEFGVTSVHSRRRIPNYDPFILASQADQVTYIRYPRLKNKQDPWITVTPVTPRGKVHGVSDTPAMQQSSSNLIGDLDIHNSVAIDLVVDFTGIGDNDVFSDSESEQGEFNDEIDSASSEKLSDSE